MTWLLFFCKFILQYLFIRVGYNLETNKYGILYWVKPHTGWDNHFICLNKGNKRIVFWL